MLGITIDNVSKCINCSRPVIFLLAVFNIFTLSCCTQVNLVPPAKTSSYTATNLQKLNILVFDPVISLKNVANDKPLNPDKIPVSLKSLETEVSRRLKQQLIDKKIEFSMLPELTNKEDLIYLCNNIKRYNKALISSFKSKDEALPYLRELKNKCGYDAIAIVVVRVNVGKNIFFDPIISGMILPQTHTTEIKIAFVSLISGQHLWSNEVFLRSLPNETILQESLDLLFNDKIFNSGGCQWLI